MEGSYHHQHHNHDFNNFTCTRVQEIREKHKRAYSIRNRIASLTVLPKVYDSFRQQMIKRNSTASSIEGERTRRDESVPTFQVFPAKVTQDPYELDTFQGQTLPSYLAADIIKEAKTHIAIK
uniref:Uncharacterized protein n=1 Tax=Glossina pallidipes TaxID=7398 RepID=A0A1A9Z947_GLOPL